MTNCSLFFYINHSSAQIQSVHPVLRTPNPAARLDQLGLYIFCFELMVTNCAQNATGHFFLLVSRTNVSMPADLSTHCYNVKPHSMHHGHHRTLAKMACSLPPLPLTRRRTSFLPAKAVCMTETAARRYKLEGTSASMWERESGTFAGALLTGSGGKRVNMSAVCFLSAPPRDSSPQQAAPRKSV